MTNQELATCAIEGIPIKVAVINNGNLGMVRQWQTLFYEERYSKTSLGTHAAPATETIRARHAIPDFVKLAEALGCVGLRCETKDDVDATIEKAMAIDDAPVVVDFIVGKDAMVWPMVAAGASNDDILAARDIRPVFEGDRVTTAAAPMRSVHTLSVLVENKPGVLARVSGLFSRRGFNIESLAVGPTENPEISRMTIVVSVEGAALEQVTKQLNKLINVLKIVELEAKHAVQRELLLVKVRARRDEPARRAADRRAVPGPGRRRQARGGHRRGHRQAGQAGGAADDARALRHPGDGAVRHGRPRPRPAVDDPGRRCARSTDRA